MASASIGGIISGFNTEEIISQMSALQQATQVRLSTRKSVLQKRKAAWEGVKTKVLALQKSAAALASPSLFQKYAASSSDTSLVTATASNDAASGNYTVTVLQTAQAQQLKSTGFADTNGARLGSGSITFQSGSNSPATITIDSTNNTLAGLRDAINRAGAGITASIVNDGDASAPYRLVLTANQTGTANQITVNSNLSGGEAMSFSTLQDARDAKVSLGDASGGITVTKPNNTITDLIQGVSLNLLGADSGKQINVTVSSDTSAVKSAVQSFADAYNALESYIAEQTKYDSDTNTSGPLIGDYSLQMLNNDIRDLITTQVPGAPAGMSLLSQVGITIDGDNALSVNNDTFSKALGDDPEGVCKLFAELGTPSDSTVKYLSSNSKTKPSDSTGYAVNLTHTAARARITAGVAQTSPLASSEILTLNGTDITLSAGMTQTEVIAAINAKVGSTGMQARASGADGTGSGNYLTLERMQYGSGYTIKAKENFSNAGGNTTGIGNVQVTETNATGE
ncbi:MAG TPA: flagellar filament capping protein FliD, partial [Armatimonadota bacterium]|nr:flagellar filament capping protein FliD [Armatimonadota bacterium]